MKSYVIINKNGDRFCKDRKWRDFALFGTFPSCVKFYKSHKWALKIAKKIGGQVIYLPEGFEMDASGKIYKVNQ